MVAERRLASSGTDKRPKKNVHVGGGGAGGGGGAPRALRTLSLLAARQRGTASPALPSSCRTSAPATAAAPGGTPERLAVFRKIMGVAGGAKHEQLQRCTSVNSAELRTGRCGLLRRGVEPSLRKSDKHHLDQPRHGFIALLSTWDLVPPHRGGARPGNWRVMRSPAAVRIPASPPTVSPIRPYPHISLSCSPLLLGMQDTANSHHPSSDKNCTAMAATKLRRSLCAEVLKTLRRPRPDAVSAAPAIESP